MAEVKRYTGRSFSKVEQQEASASKAFDDIIAKAKATNVKWGNASYVKPRVEHEIYSKKHKVDMGESTDPFSFEFDSGKSPNKKQARLQPKTVVLQPAVRITSVVSTKGKPAFDNKDEEDLTVRKGNVRTYSKGGGAKITQEDTSCIKTDSYLKPNNKQAHGGSDLAQGPPQISLQEMTEDPELYIESDDGNSTGAQDAENFLLQEEEENIFKRPKRETVVSTDGEVTVKFRSQYLNPEVYSKFTENVKPRDPVGRLSNSKVVHKNVLKHDSGTTLIVVCSPKVGNEDLKQTNTQCKYFKDNVKNLAKSKNKPVAHLSKAKKIKSPETQKEKDHFDLDVDPQGSIPIPMDKSVCETVETLDNTVSPTRESQQTHSSGITSSTRHLTTVTSPEPKSINVEEVVKSVKPSQPRKYHRIFRSRNKGFMEQQEDSNENPLNESTNKNQNNLQKTETDETTCKTLPPTTGGDMISQPNGQSQDTESEIEAAQNTSMENQQVGRCSMQPPLLISLNGEKTDSDFSNSQPSEISNSQTTDAESSSQEVEPQTKKYKILKPPPADRKIFRARGVKPTMLKKIFSSPKKVAAVYNVRSWQDDEEMSEIPKVIPVDVEQALLPPVPPDPPKLKPVTRKQKSEPKSVLTEMPRLTRAVHWQGYHGDDAYTSVHVSREHRDLFTVVKNVKEAHECQEHGETQEFDDDIEYLLAGIESIEPMSTRCLSCVGLAQKSTIPAFRMHLRAHGTVTKIFSCLQDAASDPGVMEHKITKPQLQTLLQLQTNGNQQHFITAVCPFFTDDSLALCTSALMFMLSRDRLNMDLDQQSLNLMLRLLGVEQQEDMAYTPTAEQALKRNKDRVQEVYQEFLQQSGAKQDAIDSECLSTGNLAMESLLSLTSRRAGEWFKEELRTLGALDHIVDTVCSCVSSVDDDVNVVTNSSIENLKKVDRCLRVLENVTYLNADNQSYLISYKDSSLIPSLSRALKTCQAYLSVYPLTVTSASGKVDKESFGWVVYSCILAILRVLLNLTHENESGCKKIGGQPTVMETVLLCILQLPQYVPIDFKFDLHVLSLGLLINLVEHSDNNRHCLLAMQTSPMYENPRQDTLMQAYLSLVEVFRYRETAAQQLEEADEPKTPEKSPNKSGEWRELDSGMEWVVDSAKKVSTVKTGLSIPGVDENGKDLDDEETFTKALHKAGKHMENSIVAAYVALLVGCLTKDSPECVANVKCQLPQNNFDGMIYMLKKFLGFMNLTSGAGSAGGKSIEHVIEILEKC